MLQTQAPLSTDQTALLEWLLAQPGQHVSQTSGLAADVTTEVVEVGPLLNVSTPWSTNAVSICHSIGLTQVVLHGGCLCCVLN